MDRYRDTTPALLVRYLVPSKVRGHEFSLVVDFYDVCDLFPVSFCTLVPNPTIKLTLTQSALRDSVIGVCMSVPWYTCSVSSVADIPA